MELSELQRTFESAEEARKNLLSQLSEETSKQRKEILREAMVGSSKHAISMEKKHGAIACGSPYATDVGMQILRLGGTAADAAVGAAFTLMITDPVNASPAGRAHIIWAANDGKAKAIDGATIAPISIPKNSAPLGDSRAFPIPGAVRAILKLHTDAGSLELKKILNFVCKIASDGFTVPSELASVWEWRAPELHDADARRFYLPQGRAPECGETFVQPGFMQFFDFLLRTGADPFSNPEFAEPFVDRIVAKGGLWTLEELIEANPRNGEIATLEASNWRLTSIGKQGWGPTLLRIVSICESIATDSEFERELAQIYATLCAFDERPESLKTLIPKLNRETELQQEQNGKSFNDRWNEEGEFAKVVKRILNSEYPEGRDTTHLSVMDRNGMRVALTQSIGPHFGSRIADPETGILLAHSNRMSRVPAAGVRDVTEHCPGLLDIGESRYALGAAGSERIPNAVANVVRHLLSGLDLPTAVAMPRMAWVGDHIRMHLDMPCGLEDRLRDEGVEVRITDRSPRDHVGIVHGVGIDKSGQLAAVADPAYAGTAMAE